MSSDLTAIKSRVPLIDIDNCVLCGACLAHCPTYLLKRRESESPRGRIMIMREQILTDNFQQTDSLDNCLSCGACEAMCPSKLPYINLLDIVRSKNDSKLSRKIITKAIVTFLNQQWLQQLAVTLLTFLKVSRVPLPKIIQKTTRFVNKGDTILNYNRPSYSSVPSRSIKRKSVALFTGCLSNSFDQQTVVSIQSVLDKCGYDVDLVPNQTCCGAVQKHSGDVTGAKKQQQINKDVFKKTSNHVAVVYFVSGCGNSITEALQTEELPVVEISNFLMAYLSSDEKAILHASIKPINKTVLLHSPCSLRNSLTGDSYPEQLLRLIPDVKIVPLVDNHVCCGGAGTNMLFNQKDAYALRQPKLEMLLAESKRKHQIVLATSNIGCALHFRDGLQQANSSIAIVHPVSLIV